MIISNIAIIRNSYYNFPMTQKKKFYAVASGNKPGIYDKWFGNEGAEIQIRGIAGAKYKGFPSKAEAQKWLDNGAPLNRVSKGSGSKHRNEKSVDIASALQVGKVVMYTDGGCINNPGPGGYGAVLLHGEKRKEIWAGFRLTTNNRMELTACIEGLKSIKQPAPVLLFSDSQYVVNGIQKGWAKRWKQKGWMRNATEPAVNADLWNQLLELCDIHNVTFFWVKGHAGNKENERCDQLANQGSADEANHLHDTAYESGCTTKP
jgi:ribonuclease HI